MFNRLPVRAEHFAAGVDHVTARQLFRDHVVFVGVETFSYCNRKCWFCANSFLDRVTRNLVMDEAMLEMIVRDLGDIDFAGAVNLSSYNEPLADDIIFDHIALVRARVPRADISIYSNGDFLTRERLERLHAAGLNRIYLSIHTGNDEDLNDAKVEKRIAYYRDRLGLDVQMSKARRGVEYKGRIRFRDMFIQLYEPNMRTLGSDMGGLIDGVERRYVRTCPCLEPVMHLTIEYDGSVVPCCRIRTDAPEHRDMAFCTLAEVDSLFAAYVHPRAAAWRRSVSTFGPKQGPCASCDNALVGDGPLERARFRRVEKLLETAG